MKPFWILIALTILVLVAAIIAPTILNNDDLSSYGSIISAASALLAVIWFTAGLHYQSTQLKEQRAQFLKEFKHLQESNRRDSLLMVKDILETTEQRAITHHGEISSISELFNVYLKIPELGTILNSNDPSEVQSAFKIWMKKEGAATILLRGVKSAAVVYLKSIEAPNIDYSREPEEFIYIYGPWFWKEPFFEGYEGTLTMLCELMFRLGPGRKAALLAPFAAAVKQGNEDLINMQKLKEDIKKHQEEEYPIPKIAEGILDQEEQR